MKMDPLEIKITKENTIKNEPLMLLLVALAIEIAVGIYSNYETKRLEYGGSYYSKVMETTKVSEELIGKYEKILEKQNIKLLGENAMYHGG